MNKKLFVLLPAVMLALTGCGENPSSSSSSSSSDTSTNSESSSSSSSESSSSSSSESSSSSSSESSSSSSSESSSSSSTDPVVSVSTIAEVYALAAEQAVVIEGSVTAVTAKGIVVADATGAIYAYKGTDTGKAVGDFVRVSGTTSTYHNNRQISKYGIVIAAGEGTDPHIAVPEGSAMTLASWDAFSIASSRLTMITGLVKVYQNGTFYNLKFVDGTDYSEATKYARESVSTIGVAENVDKYYDVKAYLVGSDTDWNEMIIISSTEHAVHATSVECVPDKTSAYVGDTVNLSANLTPSVAVDTVTYSIEFGAEFASIAGSVLTANAAGTVSVKATTSNGIVSAPVSIVITDADVVSSSTISFLATGADGSDLLDSTTILDNITAGADLIKSYDKLTKLFAGKNGLKLGSKKEAGVLTFTLADEIAAKTVSKITVYGVQYGSDTGTLDLFVNGSATASSSAAPSAAGTEATIGSTVSTISVQTSAKRAYLTSIKLDFAGSTEYTADTFAQDF